jgi:hypothetical protein
MVIEVGVLAVGCGEGSVVRHRLSRQPPVTVDWLLRPGCTASAKGKSPDTCWRAAKAFGEVSVGRLPHSCSPGRRIEPLVSGDTLSRHQWKWYMWNRFIEKWTQFLPAFTGNNIEYQKGLGTPLKVFNHVLVVQVIDIRHPISVEHIATVNGCPEKSPDLHSRFSTRSVVEGRLVTPVIFE